MPFTYLVDFKRITVLWFIRIWWIFSRRSIRDIFIYPIEMQRYIWVFVGILWEKRVGDFKHTVGNRHQIFIPF